MKNSISILAHTQASFAEAVHRLLGKGRLHAELVYEEYLRTGKLEGQNPAFNNAKELFREITALIDFTLPELVLEKSDGITTKILLRTPDGLEIESVVIPMQSGGTLCVSSQVGCRMGCVFCETGRMGLLRNLLPEEIISQVFIARHHLRCAIRNVVFMGMGEPFDNYEGVMQAVRVLYDAKGLGFGRKNITISTSGCLEGIIKLTEEQGEWTPNLAVSINAPSDELRTKLMPVNRKHNMEALYNAMHHYCTKTGREILTAYVLLKDQNDKLSDADRLADYLRGLRVKINLIPYNPQSCDRFQPPTSEVIQVFTDRLREHGYYTLLRQTKGKEIMAACGQLGNKELRKRQKNGLSGASSRESR